MPEPLRLSKRLIELVGCSRREVDLYIEGGWVITAGRHCHRYRACDVAAAPADGC